MLTALLCLCTAGCKVNREDIDTWTGTQKGPGKIVAVLLADKYEDELRTYAGLALVRMEPRPATQNSEPVDGVSELQAALRRLPENTRTRLTDRMAPELVRMMRGEGAPQATAEGVPRDQVRAKDAAFLLIPYASGDGRRRLTEAVVDWFVVDFNARSLEGNYSAEQVVRQLGAPAASRLVTAMNARLPQPALVKLAELIATLGDRPTKQRAAARLVEIETEMHTREFFDWLNDRLRAQLRERVGANVQINEDNVRAAAALNRENFITLGALPAMKHLNADRAVQDRLLVLAQQASSEEPGITAEHITERRTKALQALEGGARADQVEALLDLALNETTPVGVRDYAFDRISDARAVSAIPRLWPVFDTTEDWRLRWRVGTLILTLGGNDVVQEFFTKLTDPSYAPEELAGYGERISQMRPPPTDFMNTQLTSTDWWDRVVALRFWERRASATDLPRITALESDAAATAGEHWEDHDTVGKVAQAVAASIRARLERGAQGQGGAQ